MGDQVAANQEDKRKNVSVLLSSPMKIHVVINALASAILLFSIFSGLLFFQLNRLVSMNLAHLFDQPEYAWLGEVLGQIRILIPAIFFLTSILVFLLGFGIRKRLNGEMTALLAQVDAIQRGDHAYRRVMRKEDHMEPVMTALHKLSDKLK